MENYLSLMGGTINPVNTFTGAIGLAQGLQQMRIQEEQQAAAQQAAALRQRDVQDALSNPTAEKINALGVKYPDLLEPVKQYWSSVPKAKKEADLGALAGLVGAVVNGQPEVALKMLDERLAADEEAGVENAGGTALRNLLRAGRINEAKGLAAFMLAGGAGEGAVEKLLANVTEGKVVTPGASVVSGIGGETFRAPAKPEYKTITGPDGQDIIVAVGGDGGGAAAPAAAGGGGGAGGGFESFYNGWLARAEGGFAARDGKSGAPVNFGVNQAANPDVDVAKLTQPEAARILKERYWDASGADEISDPALQAVHADTAVNMGVGMAKAMLKASGGDVNKYLDAREKRYRALGGPDLDSWLARNNNLRQYVAGQGGGAPAAAGGAPGVVFDAGGRGKAPSGYEWGPDGNLRAIPGGPGDATRNLKPVPPAAFKAIQENRTALSKVDKAIREATAYPDAFGWKGFLPDTVLQRTNPQGVRARAAVADIGSLVINQRSGAAVSVAEFPRLAPFIPSVRDDPETVTTKLENMKAELAAMVQEDEEYFGPDNGYRPVPPRKQAPDKETPAQRKARLAAKYGLE